MFPMQTLQAEEAPVAVAARLPWIKRHGLLVFYLLAYAITWISVLPLVTNAKGVSQFPLSPNWHMIGALGPLLAAIVVTGLIAGSAGLKALGGRLLHWRVGGGWGLAGAGSPFLVFGLALVFARVVSGAWPDFGQLGNEPTFANWGWLVSMV